MIDVSKLDQEVQDYIRILLDDNVSTYGKILTMLEECEVAIANPGAERNKETLQKSRQLREALTVARSSFAAFAAAARRNR